MQGMMLGLLDGLTSLFSWLLSGIMSIVMTVVSPTIEFLLTLISYLLGIYFYQIGVFILGLIDYMEMLFRALAGLDSLWGKGMTLSIAGGEDGDVLLQVIRNRDVQQAFLAMCIVGLFLLVVTSVFQIIKVEYTTEGAKNSKTPIFQKAFKGLANLMLLPLLCCFGIIFSNQLLNLLDRATKTDSYNTTISGLVFTTAASEAFYKVGETPMKMTVATPHLAIVELINNCDSIIKNIANDTKQDTSIEDEYQMDSVDRKTTQERFQIQLDDYKYYKISDVSEYYNYANINYLILILSGVVILKAFVFTSFGMVMRLYKCAVLFIISPVVIGMTPVNEGGLGKWRGQFIGQVLSAYGTVLSLNLYIILIRIFINLDVSFQGVTNFVLSEDLMVGLLKSIFVMVGALMIEQFAKEIGGYFGAEDAMSAGKGMAKQVGDTAMKGVKAAGAVGKFAATGGMSLAVTAGKGIAGAVKGGVKVGKSAVNKAKELKATEGGVFKGIGHAAADLGKDALSWGKGAFHGVRDTFGVEGKVKRQNNKAISKNNKQIEKNEFAQNALLNKMERLDKMGKLDDTTKAEITAQYDALEAEKDELKAGNKTFSEMNEDIDKSGEGARNERKAMNYRVKNSKVLKGASKGGKWLGSKAIEAGERAAMYADYGFAAMQGMYDDTMQNIPGFKALQGIDKSAQAGAKKMKGGHAAAMEKILEIREDKVKDSYKNSPAGILDNINLGAGSKRVMDEFVQELKASQQNVTVEANKAIDDLKDFLSNLKNNPKFYDGKNFTEAGEEQRFAAINQAVNTLNAKGANVNFSDVAGFAAKAELNGKVDINLSDLKMDVDPKKFEKAIADAMKKSGGLMNADVLRDELTKVFAELGEKGNKNMLIQIETIIKKVMNDLK